MEKIQRQPSILRRWMVYKRLLTGKLNCLKGTGGSVFIGLIITMVVIAGLGAAMLPLSTTSTRSQITGNQAQEGYYLAESGMRYIASEFKHSADGLTACAAEDARDNVLKANHSQTFSVNDKGAYFNLDIVPYYFKVHPDLVVFPNLKAAVFGGILSEIPTDKPGYLQIVIKNDECTLLSSRNDYHYTGVLKSGDDIMFNGITLNGETPAGNAIPTQNDRIFPACKSAGGDGAGGVQTV
ncbi:hypothetical protein KKG22_05620, partial [Patescibacteria group bacterium]|nr:hypothetical protein [Patescibacteria group bacterium]